MDTIIDEIIAYPEIKSYILINNYTGEERIVCDAQLKQAFSPEDLAKIRSNRNDYWLLIEK